MITRRDLVKLAVPVALLALCSGAFAAPASDPKAAEAVSLVDRLGKQAVQTLKNRGSVGDEELRQRFRTLLAQDFDVPFIGRFVLGRYWNSATPEQQQEYQRLFQNLIVKTYAERFKQYSGETLKVNGGQAISDNDFLVNSSIQRPQGPPVNVDWRVRRTPSGLKIIDVAFENVSMAVTQRSEFDSVIQNNGGRIEALLDSLRRQASA